MADNVIALEAKNDKDHASDLKARVQGRLVEITSLMDEARTFGARVEFQLGLDGFGRNTVVRLEVVKSLA